MNKNLRVLMVGPLDRSGGVAAHTGCIAYYLKKLNIDIMLYNSSFEGNYLRIVINIIKIYNRTLRLLYFLIKKRSSFDILHVQSSGWLAGFLDAIICSISILILRRKKFIVTFHHSNTKAFLEAHKRIMGFVLKKADRFIVVSHQQEKAFRDIFPNISSIQVIPNGYDPNIFRPLNKSQSCKKLNLPEETRIILNIANLEEYKGQKYLIRSMEKILVSKRDVMLYIVGKGTLLKELQSQIGNSLFKDSIILAGGNKPAEEIPLWMNACDIFVLPSLNEGNPTVMFEALGCGKPFVGTKVGGIPEIIINAKLGFLVEPTDVDGMAKAILRALDTNWDNEYILDYARQFTWNRIAERLLEVYNEVIRNS
jgi:glycosyltransferase involved in cell wall biosynthesis